MATKDRMGQKHNRILTFKVRFSLDSYLKFKLFLMFASMEPIGFSVRIYLIKSKQGPYL